MINQNDNENRREKAKENVGIFLGMTCAMLATTVFMSLTVGVKMPGTWLAVGLSGLFVGLCLAYRRPLDKLGAGRR